MTSELNKSKLSAEDRRLILIAELQTAERTTTVSELAANLVVSPRTIERDISELRSAGMDIRSSNGRTGGLIVPSQDPFAEIPTLPLSDLTDRITDVVDNLDTTGDASKMILLAAVAGLTFEVSLLKSAALTARTSNVQKLPRSTDQTLNTLVNSGLIVPVTAQQSMRFVADSVRQVILRNAESDDLKSSHRTIGIELESRYEKWPTSDARQIALHYIQAGDLDSIERAIKFALIVGNQLVDQGNHVDAIQWFRWIVELQTDPPGDEIRMSAKLGLARALAATSQRSGVAEAASIVREIVDHYIDLGDYKSAVSVALIEIQPISGDSQFPTDVSGMLEQILKIQQLQKIDRGHLLTQYSQALLTERNDAKGATNSAEFALKIARELDDERLWMKVDQARIVIDAKLGKLDDAIGLARSIVDRAIQVEDHQTELRSRFHLVTNLTLTGQFSDAEVAANEMLDRSTKFNIEARLEQSLGILASIDMIRGRFGNALERAGRARRQFGGTSWTVLPAALSGVYDGINSGFLSESPANSPNRISRWRLGFELSILEFSLGSTVPTSLQIDNLRKLIRDFDDSGGAPNSLAIRLSIEPLLDAYEGETSRVLAWLQNNAQFAQRFVGFSGIPTASIMGLAAARIGQLELANKYFNQAIDLCRKSQAAPQLACALVNQAQINGESGTEWANSPALIEAREIADRTGITSLSHRIGTAEDSFASTESDPDSPLTKRERDVLVLIAKGKTTREIGELLFITDSTVTRHTTNILEKIGARNRVEATGYAYRSALIK